MDEILRAGALGGRHGADDGQLFKRLALANQFEMLALLDPDSADHYRRNARILRDWWPLELVPEIAAMAEAREAPLTTAEAGFVIDALELYQVLQDAEDKGFEPGEGAPGLAFPGFCGNHETKLLSFYRDARERGLFGTLRLMNPRDPNSHWPFADFYRRMIAKWDEYGRPHDLDEAQFQAIAGEWVTQGRREAVARDV